MVCVYVNKIDTYMALTVRASYTVSALYQNKGRHAKKKKNEMRILFVSSFYRIGN